MAGAKGDAQRAAQLWGAAQALHETKGVPRDIDFLAEADARISAVRSGMGEEAWEEAWRKGRAMTLVFRHEGFGSFDGSTISG